MDILTIQQAITDSTNILDETVRSQYHCIRGEGRKSNRAIAYHGGFCLAFPLVSNDNQSKICYRIWYREDPKYQQTAVRVVNNLRCIDLPYFIQCEFLPSAIRVDGKMLPGMRMDWVEGETLDKYIINNRRQPEKLKTLASHFWKMCKDLNDSGIVHGDLSNANILITKSGKIRLIDYDSLYLPKNESKVKQSTGGIPAFQHPQRLDKTNRYMSANDDFFSQHVIYLSLLAIANNPKLADMVGEEELLFVTNDYQSEDAFVSSNGYKEIANLKDEEILFRLAELRKAISSSYNQISSISQYAEHYTPSPPPIISFNASRKKLHAGKGEQVTLTWDVQNADSCTIIKPDGTSEQCAQKGSMIVTPSETSRYTLRTRGLDNVTVIDTPIAIDVYPDAEVTFYSDKKVVLPSIPITLSWQVTNAKRVTLNGKIVKATDTITFADGINDDTTYKLSVTDEFGTKEYPLVIKITSVPEITAILVPTPNINERISINTNVPTPISINMNFPQPELKSVELMDMGKFNVHVETNAVPTPKPIALNFNIKEPSLWERAYDKLNKIFKYNGN